MVSLCMGVTGNRDDADEIWSERAHDDVSVGDRSRAEASRHSLRVVRRIFVKAGDEGERIRRESDLLERKESGSVGFVESANLDLVHALRNLHERTMNA